MLLKKFKCKIRVLFLACVCCSFTSIIIHNWNRHEKELNNYKSVVFSDQRFKPLMKSFRHLEHIGKNNQFRSGNQPLCLLVGENNNLLEKPKWQNYLKQLTQNNCPFRCRFIVDKKRAGQVDAILFDLRNINDLSHMKQNLPPRDPHQPWIALAFEPATKANRLTKSPYHTFNGLFNRTMYFRRDADILIRYGFIVSKGDASLLPRTWVKPLKKILPNNIKEKFIVSFISDCKPGSGRGEYIQQMMLFTDEIDIFGKCGSHQCGKEKFEGQYYKIHADYCLNAAGNQYYFYLAFENSMCNDYVTEKVYNLLYFPIVPIVLGAVNYEELLPPHSYINAADYSPEDLVNYLNYLRRTPEEYKKYFEWKLYFQPSTLSGVMLICDLCTKLYEPSFYEYKTYENFEDWFVLGSNCDRKWIDGEGITSVDSNIERTRIVFY